MNDLYRVEQYIAHENMQTAPLPAQQALAIARAIEALGNEPFVYLVQKGERMTFEALIELSELEERVEQAIIPVC